MSRPLVVLRPEPGNGRTASLIESLGHVAVRLPLFAVAPVPWTLPAGRFDALMFTSANAARQAGPLSDRLRTLPVVAVGAATAAAARAAGFAVALVGDSDATALAAVARARGFTSLLHLAGRDRACAPGVTAVTVYASDALLIDPDALSICKDTAVLLHSPRAARRLAALVTATVDRQRIRLAALSEAVGGAAGEGWGAIAAAPEPTDAALVALGVTLAD